jgi:hypothetical protein
MVIRNITMARRSPWHSVKSNVTASAQIADTEYNIERERHAGTGSKPLCEEALKATLADRSIVGRELGPGGMATMYLAHHVKHHRKGLLWWGQQT